MPKPKPKPSDLPERVRTPDHVSVSLTPGELMAVWSVVDDTVIRTPELASAAQKLSDLTDELERQREHDRALRLSLTRDELETVLALRAGTAGVVHKVTR